MLQNYGLFTHIFCRDRVDSVDVFSTVQFYDLLFIYLAITFE